MQGRCVAGGSSSTPNIGESFPHLPLVPLSLSSRAKLDVFKVDKTKCIWDKLGAIRLLKQAPESLTKIMETR